MGQDLNDLITDALTTECAIVLANMARRSNISLESLLGEKCTAPAPTDQIEPESEPEESSLIKRKLPPEISSLESELFLFLIEILPKDIELQAMVLDARNSAVASRTAYLFLRNFIDARRTGKKDTDSVADSEQDDHSASKLSSPYYTYYRQMRQTLQLAGKSGEVFYKVVEILLRKRTGEKSQEKQFIPYYSLDPADDQPLLPYSCTEVSYNNWPCPDIDWQKLRNKPYKLEIARYFQEEVKFRMGEYFFIPVRELVNFIESKYPILFFSEENESSLQGDADDENTFNLQELPSDSNDNPHFRSQEHDLLEKSIKSTAIECCAALTADEKLLLVMDREGARLKEMASRIGYRSQSSASNVLHSAYETVKRHWMLWGPSGEYGPEWLRYYFRTVIEYCADECRISLSEDSAVTREEL